MQIVERTSRVYPNTLMGAELANKYINHMFRLGVSCKRWLDTDEIIVTTYSKIELNTKGKRLWRYGALEP